MLDDNNNKKEIMLLLNGINKFKFTLLPGFLSIYSIIYGIQFIFRTREAYKVSNLYISLSNFMDLRVFGILLIIAGALIISSLFLGKIISRPFVIIGCVINFGLWLIYVFISADNSAMQSTVTIKILISSFNLFIAIATLAEMKIESMINSEQRKQ